MENDAVQGNKTPYSGASPFNAVDFLIEQKINQLAVAVPCKVIAVYKGDTTGYVDVLPLVGTVDGKKEYVPPVNLYHLPYSRIQGGAAALIIDPVIGDTGLAVFTDADASGVTADTKEPQQPASYRRFSRSDGYYIGGFLNQKPTVFVEVDPAGKVNITAPAGLTINANVMINGTVKSTGDIVAGDISVQGHTHTGVHGETSSAH